MPNKDTTQQSKAEETRATLAHHMAEVLRIARESDDIPSGFYNDISEAWQEFVNRMPLLVRFWESEEYVRLALEFNARQRAERKAGANG